MNIFKMNGKTHIFSNGSNVTINNNQIIVNGKKIDFPDEKNITIIIEGDVGNIDIDHCTELRVAGAVSGDVKTTSGDIKCNNVSGNVRSVSGDVRASNIIGSVETVSGDINTR